MQIGSVFPSLKDVVDRLPQNHGIVVIRFNSRGYRIYGNPLPNLDLELDLNHTGATVIHGGKALKVVQNGRLEIHRHPHPGAIWEDC